MLAHINERSTISNITLEQPSQNSFDTVNIQSADCDNDTNKKITNTISNNYALQVERPRKKRKNIPESASASLMKYVQENNQNDKHPIDGFLEGFSHTLKKRPPYYQHLAKIRIFTVVKELECKAFFASQYQRNSPQPGTSSSSWDSLSLQAQSLEKATAVYQHRFSTSTVYSNIL